MAKNPKLILASPPIKTPPPFTPVVVNVPAEDFKITEAQFAQLEEAGQIALSQKLRTNLTTLAEFWIGDLRIRLSPRPKQFRECLNTMESAFIQAEESCQWDHHPQYHLVHWAMETSVAGADGFPVALAGLEQHLKAMREMVLALRECLPPDPGRQRPFNDKRRLFYLADIFEEAGGKATAYLSEYEAKGGMADTPFRKFAQHFYSLLPAGDKRDAGGLDEALRLAVMARHTKPTP